MKNALTSNNYIMFAMKHYDNPQCLDIDEFYSDINRIKYLKRLFKRYTTTGELKERLILNHIIVLSNVFGIVPCARLLFFRMENDYHQLLKTFMVFLNVLPEGEDMKKVKEADIMSIGIDQEIANRLREV
jgi:hypothetical protein